MKQQIWAHRGSSKKEAENTMAAFHQALADKADGIEIDVQLTKDGQVVVIHDEFLHRLTGEQCLVHEWTYDDLSKLDAAWHRKDIQEVHHIPLLSEVLDFLMETDLVLNIELKNSTYLQPGLEDEVLKLVRERKLEKQIVYSSFNHYSMKYMLDMDCGSDIGLLYSEMIVKPWDYAKSLGVQAIHPLFTNLQIKDFIKDASNAGIKVHAWTIDQAEYISMALQMNTDAIITNVPDLAVAIRNKEN